jgi:hypothetical protein
MYWKLPEALFKIRARLVVLSWVHQAAGRSLAVHRGLSVSSWRYRLTASGDFSPYHRGGRRLSAASGRAVNSGKLFITEFGEALSLAHRGGKRAWRDVNRKAGRA